METLELTRIPFLSVDWFNYESFQRGKKVASGKYLRCDYWHGSNAIRETNKYFYLLLTGSRNISGSMVFVHNVFRVEKYVLKGIDLTKLVDELNDMQVENVGLDEKFGALVEIRNEY